MAINFDGTSSKVVWDAINVAFDSSYAVNFKIRLTDLTGAFVRCFTVRDGVRGFMVVQEDDNLFIVGNGPNSSSWGRDADVSASRVAFTGLSVDTWYNVSLNMAGAGSVTEITDSWLEGVDVDNLGNSSLGGSAAGYNSGTNTSGIVHLGARSASGSTVSVPGDCIIAEVTFWDDAILTISDAVAFTAGNSAALYHVANLAHHYPGVTIGETTETEGQAVTYYGSPVTATHPTMLSTDTTDPIISLPTVADVKANTADLGFTTDEDNETGYWFVSTSATPPSEGDLEGGTGATSFGNATVSATGIQTFNDAGALTPETAYYAHYMQKDAAGNNSNILTSAQFTTLAATDVTDPILSSPTTPTVSNFTVDLGVSTDEANGDLYVHVKAGATPPSESDLEDGTGSEVFGNQPVTTTGAQTLAGVGPMSAGDYYAFFMQKDDAGNNSNIAVSAEFTIAAIPAISFGSDNFDSAIFNVVSSSITDAATLTPEITLVPEDYGDVGGWLMLCARFYDAVGKTPVIIYDSTDARARPYSAGNPCWKYLTDARDEWKTFDNVDITANIVTVSNNTPFTGTVEFATKPRWHYADTADWIGEVEANGNGHELASSISAGSLPTNVYNVVDPGATNANTFPQQDINLYGVRVSNDAATPLVGNKWPVVLLMGAHSSEDQGNYMLQYFVDYLLSGTTLANELLRDCNFYVYDVNPAGRAYGKERVTEGDGINTDANRAWDGTPAGSVVDSVKAAILSDVSGMKGLIDMHGAYTLGSPSDYGAYYDNARTNNVLFKTKMATKITGGYPYLGDSPGGSASEFGDLQGSEFGVTHEGAYLADGYPDFDLMFEEQALALAETISEVRSNVEQTVSLSPGVGSVALSGVSVGLSVNETLAVSSGSVAAQGQALNLESSVDLQPGSGAVAFSALPVDLQADVVISPVSGEMTINGFSVGVSSGDSLQPGVGSVALSAQNLSLIADTLLDPDLGSIAVTGEGVEVSSGELLSPGVGEVAVSGLPVIITAETEITVAPGGIVAAGLPMDLVFGVTLEPLPGVVSFDGGGVTVAYSTVLAVGAGSVSVEGLDFSLGSVTFYVNRNLLDLPLRTTNLDI